MDCQSTRILLAFLRGAERLDPAEQEAVRQHLEGCPDCAALARAERRLDAAVGAALRDVPVPAGLKDRILQKVGEQRPRPPVGWLVAAAAAVLCAAGLIGYWQAHAWPAPSFDEFPQRAEKDPEAVERWFASQGVQTRAPRMLKYNPYFVTCNLVRFNGQLVPWLEFQNPGIQGSDPAPVHVYILSASQFRLQTQPGDATMTFLVDPEGVGGVELGYLIVGDYRPLLKHLQ